jgi:TIR domain
VAGRIFLSYRRDDSGGQAGRLSDRLVPEFGRDNLFLDIDSIPLGVNFVKRLTAEVAACDILIALIGPRWLDTRNDRNERRIDQPNDFVRIEIAAALQRDIPVIPALVDGAALPRPELLPDDVKDLALRNGIELHHTSFHSDVDRLIRELQKILRGHVQPSSPVERRRWPAMTWNKIIIAAGIMGLAFTAAYYVYSIEQPIAQTSGDNTLMTDRGKRKITKWVSVSRVRAVRELGSDFLCRVSAADANNNVHWGTPATINASAEVSFNLNDNDDISQLHFFANCNGSKGTRAIQLDHP